MTSCVSGSCCWEYDWVIGLAVVGLLLLCGAVCTLVYCLLFAKKNRRNRTRPTFVQPAGAPPQTIGSGLLSACQFMFAFAWFYGSFAWWFVSPTLGLAT